MKAFFAAAALGLLSLMGCAHAPILAAASQGKDDEVSALVAQGANLETRQARGCGYFYPEPYKLTRSGDETPLICAVITGHLSTVKLLLDKGADIYAQDFLHHDAFYYARELGHAEILALLNSRSQRPSAFEPAAKMMPAEAAPPPIPPAPKPKPRPTIPKDDWDDQF